MSVTISARLAGALVVFGAALFVAGILATVLLLRVGRRQQPTDMARRILHNSALPLLIQLVVRGIDLAFVMVLFRLLSPGAVGDYELAALLVTLYLGTISEWGLGVLLTREVARDRSAIRHSFGTALLLRLGLACASLPVAGLVIVGYRTLYGSGLITSTISGQGATLIGILVLTLLPGALGAAITSIFLATEQPIIPALANLLNNVVSTALRLGALLIGFGVVGVAWGALIATVVNAMVFVWLMRRHFSWPGWGWDGELARMMLSAAFPLMLNSLLVGVFFRFDTFIIKAFRDSSAVATYGAAYKVAPLALIVPPVVVNALFPYFSRQAVDDRQGLARAYRLTLRWLLLGGLPLVAAGSVFAGALVGVIAGNEYVTTAGPVLAVLIWFIPLSYANGITQYVLIALNRQGAITLAFAVTACFNLLANALTIPIWGLTAAAATTIASEAVLYLPFRRVLHVELGPTLLLPLLWRPIVAAAVSFVVMISLRAYPIIALGMGAATYAAILWAIGTFKDEDRRLIRRLWNRGDRRPGV